MLLHLYLRKISPEDWANLTQVESSLQSSFCLIFLSQQVFLVALDDNDDEVGNKEMLNFEITRKLSAARINSRFGSASD